jgi:isopenicillin-N epimerase
VQPTRDYAAYLTVPAAIEYQDSHQSDEVQRACHAVIAEFHRQFSELFDVPPLATDVHLWHGQMVAVRLPSCDAGVVKTRLYDEYRIEVPLIEWNDEQYIRVSIQAYNSRQDTDYLLKALAEIFGIK